MLLCMYSLTVSECFQWKSIVKTLLQAKGNVSDFKRIYSRVTPGNLLIRSQGLIKKNNDPTRSEPEFTNSKGKLDSTRLHMR